MRSSLPFKLVIFIRIIFICSLCIKSSSVKSQGCPACDHYLDYIYDYKRIIKTDNFQESFKNWFFSEHFQSDESNSSTSLDVMVPIDGVPVKFGLGHESANAWKIYNSNKGSTHWDFSQVSAVEILTQVAPAGSRELWLECAKINCNSKFRISGVSVGNEVIVTISFNSDEFETAPIYESITCAGGLDCSAANKLYKNKPLKKGLGQAIKFKWIDDESTEATLVVNTNKGATLPFIIHRNIKINEAILNFTSFRFGNLDNDAEIERIDSFSTIGVNVGWGREVDAMPNTPLSPDGKYSCFLWPFGSVPADHITFKNLKYRCLEEGGYSCAFSMVMPESVQENGRYVGFIVKNWGPASKWAYSFEVFKAKMIYTRDTVRIPILSPEFVVEVPKGAILPLITLVLKNKSSISYDPISGTLPANITLVNKTEAADRKVYRYNIINPK